MKRLKLVFGIALLCAMTLGAVKAYDYAYATESEKLLLANVEALTQGENGTDGVCQSPYTVECMVLIIDGKYVSLPGTYVHP